MSSQIVSKLLLSASVLTLAACGGAGGGDGTTSSTRIPSMSDNSIPSDNPGSIADLASGNSGNTGSTTGGTGGGGTGSSTTSTIRTTRAIVTSMGSEGVRAKVVGRNPQTTSTSEYAVHDEGSCDCDYLNYEDITEVLFEFTPMEDENGKVYFEGVDATYTGSEASESHDYDAAGMDDNTQPTGTGDDAKDSHGYEYMGDDGFKTVVTKNKGSDDKEWYTAKVFLDPSTAGLKYATALLVYRTTDPNFDPTNRKSRIDQKIDENGGQDGGHITNSDIFPIGTGELSATLTGAGTETEDLFVNNLQTTVTYSGNAHGYSYDTYSDAGTTHRFTIFQNAKFNLTADFSNDTAKMEIKDTVMVAPPGTTIQYINADGEDLRSETVTTWKEVDPSTAAIGISEQKTFVENAKIGDNTIYEDQDTKFFTQAQKVDDFGVLQYDSDNQPIMAARRDVSETGGVGNLQAQFYGPEAEEVAGGLTITHEADPANGSSQASQTGYVFAGKK